MAISTSILPDSSISQNDGSCSRGAKCVQQLICAAAYTLKLEEYQINMIKHALSKFKSNDLQFPKATQNRNRTADGSHCDTSIEQRITVDLGSASIYAKPSSLGSQTVDILRKVPLTAVFTVQTAQRLVGVEWEDMLEDTSELLVDGTGNVARNRTGVFKIQENGVDTIDRDGLPRYDAVDSHNWGKVIPFDEHDTYQEVSKVKFDDVCTAYAFDGPEPLNGVIVDHRSAQMTEASIIVSLWLGDRYSEFSHSAAHQYKIIDHKALKNRRT